MCGCGAVQVFSIAIERVPTAWREDPRWRAPGGAGADARPAHLADVPSRWAPLDQSLGADGTRPGDSKLVDHLVVPRVRPKYVL